MHATLGKASCTLGTNLGMRRLGKSSTAKGIPHKTVPLKGSSLICQAAASETDSNGSSSKVAGASTDLTVIYQRLGQVSHGNFNAKHTTTNGFPLSCLIFTSTLTVLVGSSID